MEPVDYLRALRQWWRVILALTLIGVLAAYITSRDTDPTTYQATHILIQDGSTDSAELARAALLVTTGEVPNRVAEELGGDPRGLAATVVALPDAELNGLRITASDSAPRQAERLANEFAVQLIASLDGKAREVFDEQVADANAAITALQAQLAAAPLDVNLQNQLQQAQSDLDAIESNTPSASGLSTLQTAAASGTGGSTSRTRTLAIGALMGFLLGVVVSLVLARFDTRIRTKDAAEAAFGAPVVAEVPLLKKALRSRRAIVALADPESLSAEVYRGLRTALVVSSHATAPVEDSQRRGTRNRRLPPPPRPDSSRVILVVSPGMGEGKTTTAANLAVAFAETGRRVLVLGCDLRRPELHNYFDVPNTVGFTDELAKPAGDRSLANIIVDTAVPGIQLVSSGEPIEHPGELLTRGLDLVGSARDHADVVVIDTAPLLATDDASVLLPLADDVVVVCRSGRTSTEAASRAKELLDRLRAPAVGVVLIGAQQIPSARSYYRMDYRSRTRPKGAPKPKRGADPSEPSANGLPPLPTAVATAPESSGELDQPTVGGLTGEASAEPTG